MALRQTDFQSPRYYVYTISEEQCPRTALCLATCPKSFTYLFPFQFTDGYSWESDSPTLPSNPSPVA